MTYKAANDKVLVARPPELTERKTGSGILLPDKLKSKLLEGEVIAAGPDAKNVKPGDRATFLVEGAAVVEDDPTTGKVYSMSVDYVMSLKRDE